MDNDNATINRWNPCFGAPDYAENVSQTISLTAPSGTADYTLSCISLQYFDQADNGMLGTCDGTETDGSNCTNKAYVKIRVTEDKKKGSNTTVNKKVKI